MSLVRFDEVGLEFGEHILLREACMSIEAGERVCLIGRNGAGKTSLLKLITGELEPDHGSIVFRSGIGISQLAQRLPAETDHTVREVVTGGLAAVKPPCPKAWNASTGTRAGNGNGSLYFPPRSDLLILEVSKSDGIMFMSNPYKEPSKK